MGETTESNADRGGIGPRLSAIFDDMLEGVQVFDHDLRYVYVNPAAATHGKMVPDALVGRRFVDVYPSVEGTQLHRVLRRCIDEQCVNQLTNRFDHPDGSVGWFELRISPASMGVVVLSIDVTGRREAESALRATQDHLEATLACMTDGVLTTDLRGVVTSFNPAVERMSGWSAREAVGRPLADLLRFRHQRTGEVVEDPVRRVLRSGVKLGLANDTVMLGRDGRSLPVACDGATLHGPSGRVDGTVVVLRDMRDEYELASMLQQSQKLEAVGQLAGGVAHDFNNLLTVIAGHAELARMGMAPGAAQHAHLEQIGEAADRAASLTRQLLAFSRKQPLRPRVFHVADVVRSVERMLRRLLTEEIEIVTDLADDVPPVCCDSGQIEQVLMNLAVNARDAMPNGGRLEISTAFVGEAAAGETASEGRSIRMSVTDTGVGMDAATRARVFEPFFTTKPRDKGTGLGLSTAYGIVKQSGGDIRVTSRPGEGTTFVVSLPCAPEGMEPEELAPVEPSIGRRRGTVLVVEDEPPVLDLLVATLRMGGYSVLSARSGDEALRCVDGHAGRLDLLLTDVVMPAMSGVELAAEVRRRVPDIRVIYISGYTDDALERHGALGEDVRLIHKPITPRRLLDRIGTWA